jgi:hypothetical protein
MPKKSSSHQNISAKLHSAQKRLCGCSPTKAVHKFVAGAYSLGNGALYSFAMAKLLKVFLETFFDYEISEEIEQNVSFVALGLMLQLINHVYITYLPKIESTFSKEHKEGGLTIRGLLTGIAKGVGTWGATMCMLRTLILNDHFATKLSITIFSAVMGINYAAAEAALFSSEDHRRQLLSLSRGSDLELGAGSTNPVASTPLLGDGGIQ